MPRSLTLEEFRECLAEGAEAALKRCQKDLLPSRFLPKLLAEADDTQPGLALFLASFPEISSKGLEELSEKVTLPEVTAAIVRHPRTPRPVLVRLAEGGAACVREALARNRQLMTDVAEVLVQAPEFSVRSLLAENPAIGAPVQVRLAQDPVPFVRTALLKQKHLDAEALHLLATDADVVVKAKCVMDAAATPERLLEWADSDEVFTQLFLLQRENLPDTVLESLCFSGHPSVQEQAIARRKLSMDEMLGWSEKGSPAVRRRIAAKACLPPEIQELLARDIDPGVRHALAANPELTPKLAMKMAKSEDEEMWFALAQNPSLPADIVLELCTIRVPRLQKLLALRADLTPDHVVQLVADGQDLDVCYHLSSRGIDDPDMPEELALRLATDGLPHLRAFAATSRHLPRQLISKLSIDPAPVVRAHLLRNPALPERVLRFLLTDAAAEVAAAAAARLEREDAERLKAAAETPEPPPSEPPASGLHKVLRRVLKRS